MSKPTNSRITTFLHIRHLTKVCMRMQHNRTLTHKPSIARCTQSPSTLVRIALLLVWFRGMYIFGCRHRTISYDAPIQITLLKCQNKTTNMAKPKTLRLQKVEFKTIFVIIFLESVVSDGFADSHIILFSKYV